MAFIIVSALVALSVTTASDTKNPLKLCSSAWQQMVDEHLTTGDNHGHGPDVGSDEWKSVVEFKLNIRGMANIPQRDSMAWCEYIDERLKNDSADSEPKRLEPSFSCESSKLSGVEKMICQDDKLKELDVKLAAIYTAAKKKSHNEHPPLLQAEQRGWIKDRNECWKSNNQRECIETEYVRRTAELQAKYRLVPSSDPVKYMCGANPANEVVVTFFDTSPPTLIAERGDSTSLMHIQRSASGSKYQGRNESFWGHQGEALISWGYNEAELQCIEAP
ncbi:MliC family protein [Colwellia asteriadis]|uniref:MliC family protein n=1 Tax=Colwellia asteriadis TaxID=517723 RepID=A0ABP3WBN4_9GAMM